MTDSSTRVLDARLLFSIVAAGIMSFSGVVVETAMNVTFPTLMQEFNIGTSLVQWITTGYLLVLALIIPTSAYLKRRFATRSLFTAAIASFLGGTLLAAWSPYFNVLLIGRLLQGIGTGIALPMMFNIILEQVPGERLGFMIGIASLISHGTGCRSVTRRYDRQLLWLAHDFCQPAAIFTAFCHLGYQKYPSGRQARAEQL